MTPQSPPQTDADGKTSKDGDTATNDGKNRSARASGARALGQHHQRSATPAKKSGAKGVMSVFGRHDTLMMARRMEAVQAVAQYAVSTATRVVKALDLVEGQWFRVLPE
eukprot:3628386-Prymnesium_polylepis.1